MSELVDFDTLWDYDDAAATEVKFRALLLAFHDSGQQGKYVELLTQLARAEGLQKKFDEAHGTLDLARDLLGAAGARGTVRYLLERGRAYNSAGKPSVAQPLFEQAWDVAVTAGEDRLAIDAAHMVAIVAPQAEQLDWTEKALDLVERSTDPGARNWLGPLYNNVGWTYLEAGRAHDALEAFRKGLNFRLEKGDAKPIRIARYAVGRALRALGWIDEALAIQQELDEEWAAAGESSPYVAEEIGECLSLLGHPLAEAAPYFARAYDGLSSNTWLVEHEPARLGRLRDLGAAKSG